jgi:Family of unknown function (DUF6325)
MGPLEYVVIEFEGNHLTGEIVPELHRLRDLGIVRVVDLLLIQKDAQGRVSARELSDLSEEEAKPYWPIAGEVLDLLSEADVETAAADLPLNSSGAIALLEHTWATHLQETIRKAQGRVLSGGLLPAAEVERLAAELTAEHAATPM